MILIGMTRLAIAIAGLAALSPPVSAVPPPLSLQQSELYAAERALEQSRERQTALAAQHAELQNQDRRLADEMIETTALIKAREALIADAEQNLRRLAEDERMLQQKLARRSDELSMLLSGLVKLDQNPPPALLAAPGDALDAVRAAMLFGAAVPLLRNETQAVSLDLARLSGVRASLDHERQALDSNLDKLHAAHLKLEALHRQKQALLATTGQALADERLKAARLAEQAKTLKQLVDALSAEALKRRAVQPERPATNPQASPLVTQKPPLPFTQALGRLEFPVQGELIRRYGETDALGSGAKGIFIATRSSALVATPAYAHVEFAGPFRSYGQLLILDVGEGYHVVLAGMARIRVETGQTIAAGEPVGEMGEAPAEEAMLGGEIGDPRPVIYVEFRKAGNAVDSSRWWFVGNREARSQKGMN